MPLSADDVSWVARLARLRLSQDEIAALAPQLAQVIEYVEQLRTIPTDGIEPLTHPNESVNQFRDDVPAPSLPVQAALANAPVRAGDFFVVPKVLD